MFCELFKRKILNILFPIECVGCGREDVYLCQDCLLKMPLGKIWIAFSAEKAIRPAALARVAPLKHHLDGVFVCADYSDRAINELIKKLKYSFARELGAVLARNRRRLFAEIARGRKIEKNKFANYIIAPIPLHKKRFNWRGFNQAELIARHIAQKFKFGISGFANPQPATIRRK